MWSWDEPEAVPRDRPIFSWVPKVGIGAWSFVGFVVATTIVMCALATVSEIVVPLTFAVVLAVVFKPIARRLERYGCNPVLAAGLIVLGLLALTAGVVVATVRGIVQQTGEICASVEDATAKGIAAIDIV